MPAMLRSLVIGVGALCFLGGLVALVSGFPFGFLIMIGAAAVLAGTLYERVLYKAAVKAMELPALRSAFLFSTSASTLRGSGSASVILLNVISRAYLLLPSASLPTARLNQIASPNLFCGLRRVHR